MMAMTMAAITMAMLVAMQEQQLGEIHGGQRRHVGYWYLPFVDVMIILMMIDNNTQEGDNDAGA